MTGKRIRVAVLFGGVSSEHEVSLMSVESVLANLPQEYEVLRIGITKDGRWVEYTGKPTYDIEAERYVRVGFVTTREGKIRWVADGRWNFNGLTRDEVMDAMRRCTEVPAEDVECGGCPMHGVQDCCDELMRAAHELLKNDDFVFSQWEDGHGKQ